MPCGPRVPIGRSASSRGRPRLRSCWGCSETHRSPWIATTSAVTRDATAHLIDRLLAEESEQTVGTAARFDESVVTWGLEAVRAFLRVTAEWRRHQARQSTRPASTTRTQTSWAAWSRRSCSRSKSSEGDVQGHGTHCIGTACGPLRPAGVPRYGIAHEAQIFAGKVLGDDGFGTDRLIIAGMDWAVEQGCQVISMSLGAATSIGDQPNDDYEQIGQVCLDAGVLVVAAAGNESDRPRLISPVGSPANASTIMSVGAVD